MRLIGDLERTTALDRVIESGQRVARLIRPGPARDAPHGVWLSGGDYRDGCLTCPWHGSTFRVADGSVARGPATAPQPVFRTRVTGGILQVCLPGAG